MERVAIIGSRGWSEPLPIDELVEGLDPETTIVVTGGADGADRMAELSCEAHGVHYARIPALWRRHNRAAGPIRNRWIERMSDRVVAFWDGKSTGTKGCVDLFLAADKPVVLY